MRERLADTWLLLGMGWRVDRRLTTSYLATMSLVTVAATIRALWFKLVIDAVTAGRLNQALAWAAVLAVSDAARSWGRVRSQMDQQDVHDRTMQFFQAEAMRLSGGVATVEHHELAEHIDRLSVLRSSFRTLSTALAAVVEGIMTVVRTVVTFVLLASVHPALLLLPLFALPSLWTARRAQTITHDASLATASRSRLAEHLWAVLTTPGPVKEVRVFGVGPELRRRDQEVWADVTKHQSRAKLRAGAITAGGWTVFAAGYVAAIVLVATLAVDGRSTPGDVLLAVVLAGQVSGQVAGAASLVGTLSQTFQAVSHYRWLRDFASGRRPASRGRPVPVRLAQGVRLDDVTFTYPGTGSTVLHDIALDLPAGAVVALVGENGAGKTTLTKLLAGLYHPTGGRLTVDGVPLDDLDLGDWRAAIAAGFQDFVRFELLAREAVGVGDLPHVTNGAAVARALELGGASSIPATLPAGIESQLGKMFDGGVDLSGGQWQKVALARAMMRPAPLLLILDEPTAALDAPSEHALFERYAAQARATGDASGTITVLVSHRFSTVRMADRIVVLDNGRIREVGTHAELIARADLYAELFELQARSYR